MKHSWLCQSWILLLPFLSSSNFLVVASGFQIDLEVGSIQGKIDAAKPSDKTFASFTSIPYAEPPIGKLRFKDPVVKSSWSGVLDATRAPPACAQLNQKNTPNQLQDPEQLLGTEDCLVLNVYVPLDQNTQKFHENKKIPVMIYVHGGAFIMGTGGPQMYGPDYFMAESVNPIILVTLNYRLGILGFLSLGDDVISGNMGLKDQTLAMKWVQDHISKFGGDPEQVTIFGESAGGISIMAHLVSPWSKGLFHRAIVQSGPLVSAKVLHMSHPPEHYAKIMIEDLETEDEIEQLNSLQLLDLLQNVPLKDIVARNGLFEKFMFMSIPWKPLVDNYASKPFIPTDPKILISEGNYNQVPIMIGGNTNEGCMYLVQFLANEERFEEVAEDFDNFGPQLFLGLDEDDITEQDSATANLIKNEYLDGLHTNFTKDNWKRISDIFSDVLFLVPTDQQARLFQDSMEHPVYYYRYNFKGAITLPMFYDAYSEISSNDFGVCHADELFIQFRNRALGDKNEAMRTEKDVQVTDKMIQLWTRFAHGHQPHPEWQPLSKDYHQWARIDHRPLKMEWSEEFEHRAEFVQTMSEVLQGYRNMNWADHPAVQAMMDRPPSVDDDDDEDVLGEGGEAGDSWNFLNNIPEQFKDLNPFEHGEL